ELPVTWRRVLRLAECERSVRDGRRPGLGGIARPIAQRSWRGGAGGHSFRTTCPQRWPAYSLQLRRLQRRDPEWCRADDGLHPPQYGSRPGERRRLTQRRPDAASRVALYGRRRNRATPKV